MHFCSQAGDYGLIPVGVGHSFHNLSDAAVELAEMKAPLPRSRFDFDTFFPKALGFPQTFESRSPVPIDVRDPRNRLFGHIDAESMDAGDADSGSIG